jgi:uncharacterized protein YbcV (DUF1398 family)
MEKGKSVMQSHVKAVVTECTVASREERISFPEVLRRLAEVEVERYHADLVRGERTYYLPDGESEVTMGDRVSTVPAAAFAGAEVEAAIRAVQRGEIRYGEFCERIAAAGCVGYIVTLAGRRAVYYGRTGDVFVERFPPAR